MAWCNEDRQEELMGGDSPLDCTFFSRTADTIDATSAYERTNSAATVNKNHSIDQLAVMMEWARPSSNIAREKPTRSRQLLHSINDQREVLSRSSERSRAGSKRSRKERINDESS